MATFTPENASVAVDIRHLLPWVVIGTSGPIGTIGNIEINAGQDTAVVSDLQSATPVNYSGGTGLTGSPGDPSGGTFTTITRTGVGALSGITRANNFAEIDAIDALRILDGDDTINGSSVGLDFLFAGYDGSDVLNGNGGGDNFVVAERPGTPFLTITGASNVVDTLFVWNNIFTSATFLDLRISNLNSIDAITLDPGTGAIILAAQLGSAISTTAVIGATSGSAFFDIVKQTDGGTVDASALTVNANTLLRIFGTATGETIIGDSDGPTDLHPGAGTDIVNGGNGDDFFFVAGNEGEFDTLNGGGGTDTLTVEGTAGLILNGFNAAESSIEIFDGNGKGLFGRGIANVFNLAGLTEKSGLAFIDGGVGKDTITGSNFADVIVAGNSQAQFDVMKGGLGTDTLRAAGGALVLNGFNAAASSIEIFDGNGKGLLGNGDANVFNLAGLTGTSGLAFIDGGAGNDTITGSNFADVIVASGSEAQFDVMKGGLGNDTLRATGGTSLVLNGFQATLASIEKFEGNGKGLLGNGVLNIFNLAGLTTITGLPFINGGGGRDWITGSNFADVIVASGSEAQTDVMNGGLGTDTLRATGGAPLVLSGFNAAAASIEKFEGNGKGLGGSVGSDVFNLAGLTAVIGLPFIDGGLGNDTITGSRFTDTIRGGGGLDTMNGGAGAVRDVFDFNSVNEMGRDVRTRDTIVGFQHLLDDIDLSTIDANGAADGDAFTFLATREAVFTGARGQLRWFQEDGFGAPIVRTIVAGDINGDKVADFQIELRAVTILSAADFIL